MPDVILEVVLSEGNNELRTREAITVEGLDKREVAVPAATTDKAVALAIDVSQIEVLVIKTDQDVTLETNSSSAASQSLALKANRPYVWRKSNGITNPLTVDVTQIFLTNAGASDATVSIWIGTDATP